MLTSTLWNIMYAYRGLKAATDICYFSAMLRIAWLICLKNTISSILLIKWSNKSHIPLIALSLLIWEPSLRTTWEQIENPQYML